MVKRILVGICDPSYSLSAACYASEMAREYDARVTAIAVTDLRQLLNVGQIAVGSGGYRRELIDARLDNNEAAIRMSFDVFSRRLHEDDVDYVIEQSGGDPYEALINASRYHDVMIFGLRGLFEHGVTDEPPHELVRLVEAGVRPIVAVGPKYRETKRVMLAYSGSVESARTLKSYASLGLWPHAETLVVHFGAEEDADRLLGDAQSYLDDHGLMSDVAQIDLPPKTNLLPHAEEWNADMVVLGNSAKSLLSKRIFGETALNTIRTSSIPLFLSQ